MKLQKRQRKVRQDDISVPARHDTRNPFVGVAPAQKIVPDYPVRSYNSELSSKYREQRPIGLVSSLTPPLRTEPPRTLVRARPRVQPKAIVLPSILLIPIDGQVITLFRDPTKRDQRDSTIDRTDIFNLTLHRFGKYPLRPIGVYVYSENAQPFFIRCTEGEKTEASGTKPCGGNASETGGDGQRAVMSFKRDICETPVIANDPAAPGPQLVRRGENGNRNKSIARYDESQQTARVAQARPIEHPAVSSHAGIVRHSRSMERDTGNVERTATAASWSPEDFSSTIRRVDHVHFSSDRRKTSRIERWKEACQQRRYSMGL